ncbi:MAG: recombination protein RecR [Desulfobacteraceae bacterium]|nr:recombination protein RecR [Desulfobacteraceae bacterium]
MLHHPKSIINLIRNLGRLPGIGEKTAERLALHILNNPSAQAQQLALSITHMKESVRLCRKCFGYSDHELCTICGVVSRNTALLCVVEQPADMTSIEKSGGYNGLYFILGGVLAPMDGVGPEHIRIGELMKRVERGEVKEVILATGTHVEGESTSAYLAQVLRGYPVTVSRIASGVPVGGDLKYVDQVTLKKAMEKRHAVE